MTTPSNPGRLSHITRLTSFGVALVVFGHSFPAAGPEFLWRIHQTIYTFHMPLFIFISGFLFAHTTAREPSVPFAPFVRKKALRLLVPYAAISAAAFPVKAILSRYAWRSAGGASDFFMGLLFPLRNTIFFFWFLPTLFLIFLAAPAFHRAAASPKRNAVLPAIIVALIAANILLPADLANRRFHADLLNMSGAAKMAVFFFLGALARLNESRLKSFLREPVAVAGIAVLTAFNIFAPGVMGMAPAHIRDFQTLVLYQAVHFLLAVVGIAMSWAFISFYERRRWNFFRPIDGWSYQIYLLSWFPQSLFRILVFQALRLGFLPAFLLMFAGGLFIPVLIGQWTLRRLPRLGWLIGIEQAKEFSAAK